MRRVASDRPPRRAPRPRTATPATDHSLPAPDRATPYTIGRLAVLARVSADTLRYYEREHLLQPRAKSGGGYRLYDEEAARRVRFIRHAQECGFTLAEIRDLLTLRGRDSACCDDVRRIAVQRKLQLEAKIRSMKAMSATLDRLIAACRRDGATIDACPILLGLDQAELRK